MASNMNDITAWKDLAYSQGLLSCHDVKSVFLFFPPPPLPPSLLSSFNFIKDQLKMVKETLAKLPEDEVPPLFDEQGEGVDPKDLDMNQLPNSSTSTIGKKRGVSDRVYG